MGIWEPDLSSSETVSRIRQPTFGTVFRGYDPNQVLEYLSGVAEHVEALESQMAKLELELREARQQATAAQGPGSQDPYDAISARVADLVRTFDQDVEKLRAEAEAEVDRLLAEAKADAERVRLEAQGKADEVRGRAERTLRDARREAEQVVSDLTARRDALLDQLRGIRDRMLDNVGALEGTINGAAAGDQVVVMENARDGEPADAASSGPREARPQPGA